MAPRLCFVLFSPRSGSTRTAHLLDEHPAVVMGLERYKFRWPDWPQEFTPELFERERFLDLRPDDTNVRDSPWWDAHYGAHAAADWDTIEVAGDKLRPFPPRMLRGILEKAPDTVFVHTFRRLLPVASSYAVRAANPDDTNWSAETDATAAAVEWRRELAWTAAALEDPDLADRVLAVAYEDLLSGDPVTNRAVFDHVGLEWHADVEVAVAVNAQRYRQVQQTTLSLTYEEAEKLVPLSLEHNYRTLSEAAPRSRDRDRDRPEVSGGALEQHVSLLEAQLATTEEQLARLRRRRSVRAALRLAEGWGRLRDNVREAVADRVGDR